MRVLRCDQCGRALTPSDLRAGFCPSCGHAIAAPTDTFAAAPSTDDSQTRPMPPSAPPTANRSNTPPLPPATESLTAPANAPAAHRPGPSSSLAPSADDRTAAMPAHLMPSPSATQPAMSAGDAGNAASQPKGSRWGWISALALLIVLVLGSLGALLAANGQLGGILGGAPNPTPTASPIAGPPPPPSGFARYTGDGYTVNYPTAWAKATQPSGLVLFTNPAVQANFVVQTFNQVTDPQSLDGTFINGLGASLLNGASGTTALSGKTAPTMQAVAGTLWTREEADVAVTSGGTTASWHVVALAVAHNQRMFLVTFFAPATVFPGQDSAFFEPMVNSLLLVSSQP